VALTGAAVVSVVVEANQRLHDAGDETLLTTGDGLTATPNPGRLVYSDQFDNGVNPDAAPEDIAVVPDDVGGTAPIRLGAYSLDGLRFAADTSWLPGAGACNGWLVANTWLDPSAVDPGCSGLLAPFTDGLTAWQSAQYLAYALGVAQQGDDAEAALANVAVVALTNPAHASADDGTNDGPGSDGSDGGDDGDDSDASNPGDGGNDDNPGDDAGDTSDPSTGDTGDQEGDGDLSLLGGFGDGIRRAPDTDGTADSDKPSLRFSVAGIAAVPGHFYSGSLWLAALNCRSVAQSRPGDVAADLVDPSELMTLAFDTDDGSTTDPATDPSPLLAASINPCDTVSGQVIDTFSPAMGDDVPRGPVHVVHAGQDGGSAAIARAPQGAASMTLAVQAESTAPWGNDLAFDGLQLVDVTPRIEQEFSPAQLVEGQIVQGSLATLRITLVNTSDLLAKTAVTFTEHLPDGIDADIDAATVVDVGGAPIPDALTVTPGQEPGTVTVEGSLDEGVESLTVIIPITAVDGPGTYTNQADSNISDLWGLLEPSADAVLTVTEADEGDETDPSPEPSDPGDFDTLEPEPPSGVIAGTVFIDSNANGLFDTAEGVLQGVLVTLTDDGSPGSAFDGLAVLTDSKGNYVFDGLDLGGRYQVTADITMTPGYEFTQPQADPRGATGMADSDVEVTDSPQLATSGVVETDILARQITVGVVPPVQREDFGTAYVGAASQPQGRADGQSQHGPRVGEDAQASSDDARPSGVPADLSLLVTGEDVDDENVDNLADDAPALVADLFISPNQVAMLVLAAAMLLAGACLLVYNRREGGVAAAPLPVIGQHISE
jgi:hypothetical protein